MTQPASAGFGGRVVVVSGAGSRGEGIGNGRAAAILLARAGARVALLDRKREWAEATAELITADGHTALVIEADVADPGSCAAAVDEIVGRFGGVYGLVNNVGIGGAPGTEGTGWDVGHAVRFLLSDEARWVTGVVFPVDAGAHAGTPSYPALPALFTTREDDT